ncbi:MAG TPA: ATP-binding protein [Candidatus Sulfotelmatobacter sp.]|nr:ATP-binding protein [Candidatus Sulfotelmatobacter sp.]
MQFGIKRFLPRSLFGRSLLILVTPVVLLQIVSTYVFYEQHWETMSKRLSFGVAGDIAMVVEELGRDPAPASRDVVLGLAATHTAIYMRFAPGEILPNVPPPDYTSLGATLAQMLDERLHRPFQIDDESDDRVVFVAVQLPDGVLHTWVPRKRLFSSTTYVFILWMVGTSLILYAIAGIFMRNQVRPIRRLAAAAESFGKGHDVRDFKPEGASEVRRAAIEFNHMRERITRQIAQRTAMLAGVSHDLRTPLTRLKLQLAMLGDGPDVEAMKTDVAEMETMLEAYLAFVRGEGAEAVVSTELKPLLEEVVGGARREGRQVALDVDGDIRVQLRPNAFRRGITNLVANACRYGRTVAVSAHQNNGTLELTVDDDGPGIPPEKREDAFRPFFRFDASRNKATGGVGLGLTIARDVARGHGGDVILGTSPLGGLRATVRLPV